MYRTRAIISRSWLQAALVYKPYLRTEFSEKKTSLKNKEMVIENGVKNIQAAAYNGARTVGCHSLGWDLFLYCLCKHKAKDQE